jgi:hypothetical protein
MLAVAMNQRSAADELGVAAGDQVTLTDAGDDGGDDGPPPSQPVTIGRR